MQLPFRSAASTTARRFSGIIAVSLLAAGYAVAPISAAARDIEGLPPQCAKAGSEIAKLKCGSAHYRQMKADADAQRAAAEARSAVSKNENACLDLIMSDLKANGTKTANLTEPPKKGEACKIAKSLQLTAG